jgi:hypothetical protein
VILLISDFLFPGGDGDHHHERGRVICIVSWYLVPLRRRRLLYQRATAPAPAGPRVA